MTAAYTRPAMDFLNVLAIKKLAAAKGCTAERTVTVSYKHYVALYDAKGAAIDGAKRGVGFSLAEAKRRLEAMPDVGRKGGGRRNRRQKDTCYFLIDFYPLTDARQPTPALRP